MKHWFLILLISIGVVGCAGQSIGGDKPYSGRPTEHVPRPQVGYQEISVKELPIKLQKELEQFLGTNRIFFLTAVTDDKESRNNLLVLTNPNLKTRELQFPIKTEAIIDVTPLSVFSFTGSHCRAVNGGGGTGVISCTPPTEW